jgi:hypothetical protein
VGGGLGTSVMGGLFQKVADYLTSIVGGSRQGGALRVYTGAVAATDAVTFSSLANNNTVTVNGTVFTAKTSGASGNAQFNLGANDTAAATNFAAIVNAHPTEGQRVSATSAAAVTTLTCLIPGTLGNMCTLAISANGSVTGANFAGGSWNSNIYGAKGV